MRNGVIARCQACSSCCGASGYACYRSGTHLCARADHRRCRRGKKRRRHDEPNGPYQEPVGGITKKYLVRMYVDPLGTKAPRQISAEAGGDDLHQDQPDDSRDAYGFPRRTGIHPRRYGRKSKPGSKRHQDKRDRGGYEGAANDSAPGHAGRIGFVFN